MDLPNYCFDNRGRVRPGLNTPTLNFKKIKELLLSKNHSQNDSQVVVDDEFRFFDGTTNLWGNMVAL